MGQVLYDEIVRHVQLLEADYFDLEYTSGEKLTVSYLYTYFIS